MKQFFKRADLLNPRVVEESRIRTARGGALFLIASLISCILAINSFWSYLAKPEVAYVESIQVDTALSSRLPIELNITFPRLSCLDVELVALDVSGEVQLDVTSNLRKTRLRPDGQRISDEDLIEHVNQHSTQLPRGGAKSVSEKNECGSCYGAESGPADCCTTCHDVKDRYAAKGWDVQHVSKIAKQCLAELDHAELPIQPNEGCVLTGNISINKVAGTIHVALGMTQKLNGQVVHTFVQDQMGQFDTSHVINLLRFGNQSKSHSGLLDGTYGFVDHSLGRTAAFHYFMHLVPTRSGRDVSFRYTKTSKYLPILEPTDKYKNALSTEGGKPSGAGNGARDRGHAFTLPGVYFMYDFSPFVVVREQREVLLIDLITDLLTVAGSVFALMRLLDYTLYLTIG